MPERDYSQSPVTNALGLRAVIDGLASDLQDVRNGNLDPQKALAHAALAKQYFNGCRIYLAALNTMTRPERPPVHDAPILESPE